MGSIGSSCVRDCVRSPNECAPEDGLGGTRNGDTEVNVVVAGLPTGGRATGTGTAGSSAVPPVPNWFQVLQDGRQQREQRTETPRFDEVFQSAPLSARSAGTDCLVTPRGLAGGEFRTPRPSPRDSARSPGQAAEEAVGAEGDGEETYEGAYLGKLKHGAGRLRSSGCTYEGEFMEDCKHGVGTLLWDDGRKYRGDFKFGKFDGCAVMTWPDGRHYRGQYCEDRKHGEGIFSWQDGRRYDGQWICGKRHGVGIYTNAKGFTRRGTWQNDRPILWEAPCLAPLAECGGGGDGPGEATPATADAGAQSPAEVAAAAEPAAPAAAAPAVAAAAEPAAVPAARPVPAALAPPAPPAPAVPTAPTALPESPAAAGGGLREAEPADDAGPPEGAAVAGLLAEPEGNPQEAVPAQSRQPDEPEGGSPEAHAAPHDPSKDVRLASQDPQNCTA